MGLQEVRLGLDDVDSHGFHAMGALRGHFACASRKGYAGVALLTRHEPSEVIRGIGVPEFDDEGRWIELRFDTPRRKLAIVSCYFPSGSAGEHRQAAKFRFLDAMGPHLRRLASQREFILVGDVNIAHHEIDLTNWKSNQKHSGFLPEERVWMSALLGGEGRRGPLVDVYRHLRPDTTDACYTWWSNRGQARANNVGWRIDYHLATPGLAAKALVASIYKRRWFSDHAPLTIDYDFTL